MEAENSRPSVSLACTVTNKKKNTTQQQQQQSFRKRKPVRNETIRNFAFISRNRQSVVPKERGWPRVVLYSVVSMTAFLVYTQRLPFCSSSCKIMLAEKNSAVYIVICVCSTTGQRFNLSFCNSTEQACFPFKSTAQSTDRFLFSLKQVDSVGFPIFDFFRSISRGFTQQLQNGHIHFLLMLRILPLVLLYCTCATSQKALQQNQTTPTKNGVPNKNQMN